jgi:hypothetical protein
MNSFKCDSCNISLSSNRNLQKHVGNGGCSGKLNCICGKKYKIKKWYDKHILTCNNKVAEINPKLTQINPKLTQINPKLTQNNSVLSNIKYPNNDCPYCGMHFQQLQGVSRHVTKSCKNNTTNNDTSTSNINNGTNNTNNGTIHINNNNFVLNNFGHENLSHLTVDDKVDICSSYMDMFTNAVEKTYFDPEHPENHTVMIKSEKNKQMFVYDQQSQMMSIRPLNDIINFVTTVNYARVCKFMRDPLVIEQLNEDERNSFELLKQTYKLDSISVKNGMNEDVKSLFLSHHYQQYKKLTL